jgi:tyrosine-protein phosphatase SIW14
VYFESKPVFKLIKQLQKIAFVVIIAVIAISCVSTAPKEGTSRPANWAVCIQKPGLPNFCKVSDDLYRGAQPTATGIVQLKNMGIKTIIDLRALHSDKDLIGNTDIGYEYIGVQAWSITENDIIKFLKIVTDKEKTPVFVHCQRGADRTGFMVAVYRVAVCGWSKDAAIDEMTHGGYEFSPLWGNLVDNLKKLDVEKIRELAGI